MAQTQEHAPAEVFPPGEFLKDELDARGWTQIDLSEILGRPPRVVNEIIAGKRSISADTARSLAQAFGTSAEYWINLETAYQLHRGQRARPMGNDIEKKAALYGRFPVRELVRRHWIEPSDNVEVLETRLLQFFRMQSLEAKPALAFAARKAAGTRLTPLQEAWVCRAWQLAERMPAGNYSPKALQRVLAQLKTLLAAPEEARHVPRILQETGVTFLIIEPVPATKIDGICFWLSAKRPVIALSLRLDRLDYFWFTLLHELMHVKHGHAKDGPILDTDLMDQNSTASPLPMEEQIANDDTRELLIPQAELDNFIARVRPYYAREQVLGFARRLGIHPALVVGQLQYRGEIPYSHFRNLLVQIRSVALTTAITDGWGQRSLSI